MDNVNDDLAKGRKEFYISVLKNLTYPLESAALLVKDHIEFVALQ